MQVLSNLWKGTFDSQKGPITTEFLGDGKNFEMRWVAYQSDGTVTVLDAAASFRFLEIADDSLGNLGVTCVPTSGCIFVRCLYKRDCMAVRLSSTIETGVQAELLALFADRIGGLAVNYRVVARDAASKRKAKPSRKAA